MIKFKINDDVQYTIEMHIKNSSSFSFIISESELSSDLYDKSYYVWLLTSNSKNVLSNFINTLEDKYRKFKGFEKSDKVVTEKDNHIFLKITRK